MRRYEGEELPLGARIAVIASDALGNYVVTTPLLQMLRAKFKPDCLDYYSGSRTEELWSKDLNVSWGFPLFGTRPDLAIREARSPYDLIVNVESSPWAKAFCSLLATQETLVAGPCLSEDGRGDLAYPNDCNGRMGMDRNWIAEDVVGRHCCLATGFIGEIFCRLAYLKGPIPPYSVPREESGVPVFDVVISASASLPEKLWGTEKWIEALQWMRNEGLTICLVGAKIEEQRRFWFGATTEDEIISGGLAVDLRGSLTLPRVVGTLAKARACFTLDNGILHLAAAVNTPAVGIFRYGYHRLWAPPSPGLRVLASSPGGLVADITVKKALDAFRECLSSPSGK